MGRRENPVVGFGGEKAVGVLAHWLRDKRQHAGLSYRQLADRTKYTHTTLSRAADGRGIPRLEVVDAYARACDADVAEARRLWRKAREARGRAEYGTPSLSRPELVHEFVDLHQAMLALWQRVGAPSLRELERRAGEYGELPRSSLHRVLKRQAIPHRWLLLAFVQACGVRGKAVEEWGAAWDRAKRSDRAETLEWDARSRAEALERDARTRADALEWNARVKAEALERDARAKVDFLERDARTRADALEWNARVKAEALERDARAKADFLERDAQEKHRVVMGSLERVRATLEHKIEDLRRLECEHRTQPKPG